MKLTKLQLAALLITPLLTQCLVVDENGNAVSGSSTPPANVSGSPQESQQVFDQGFNKGQADGRNGLSRNPGRHAGQYPAAESDAFGMGYEKGYNQGIR